MAVTYSTTLKNTRMTAVRDAANNGSLRIGTSGMGTLLATFPLSATSGSVSGGVLTLSLSSSSVTAAATGTAAAAEIRASDGTTVLLSGLTVGTSGTDIVINATAISSGQNVATSGSQTITHS